MNRSLSSPRVCRLSPVLVLMEIESPPKRKSTAPIQSSSLAPVRGAQRSNEVVLCRPRLMIECAAERSDIDASPLKVLFAPGRGQLRRRVLDERLRRGPIEQSVVTVCRHHWTDESGGSWSRRVGDVDGSCRVGSRKTCRSVVQEEDREQAEIEESSHGQVRQAKEPTPSWFSSQDTTNKNGESWSRYYVYTVLRSCCSPEEITLT